MKYQLPAPMMKHRLSPGIYDAQPQWVLISSATLARSASNNWILPPVAVPYFFALVDRLNLFNFTFESLKTSRIARQRATTMTVSSALSDGEKRFL